MNRTQVTPKLVIAKQAGFSLNKHHGTHRSMSCKPWTAFYLLQCCNVLTHHAQICTPLVQWHLLCWRHKLRCVFITTSTQNLESTDNQRTAALPAWYDIGTSYTIKSSKNPLHKEYAEEDRDWQRDDIKDFMAKTTCIEKSKTEPCKKKTEKNL